MTEPPITFDQVGCARCDGDGHEHITFQPFTRPMVVDAWTFTHWAMCPTVNEPILLTSTPDEPS